MCEVIRSNFEEILPEIERAINSSDFIAFDGEFTCLSASNTANASLTDTAEIRYGKLKRNVSQSSLCQFGIAAFIPDQHERNSYAVKTFNFYLFPHPFGPNDCRFLCQASSVQFLCENNFDFNKFMYHGIPYLNQDQEKLLRNMHQHGKVQQHCSSSSIRQLDEGFIRDTINDIYYWREESKVGDTKTVSVPFLGVGQYLILSEFQNRFDDVTCQFTSASELTVTKRDGKLHSEDIKACYDQEFEKLFQAQIGFSRVVHLLSKSRKPLVGHNCLTDLFFIFEKFHKPLPEKYKDFKVEMHELFSHIYDTKHISAKLRRTIKDTDIFSDTNLEDLHEMLSSKQGIFYALGSPHITHAHGYDNYANSNRPHEAGYDAYLTGYVFLRMAHLVASKSSRSDEMKFKEHLQAVRDFRNCVNIARAAIRYINIEGEDAPAVSRERFIVTLKGRKKSLTAAEIAHEFLPFGSVDVQIINLRQAIVTVSHNKRARSVVRAFGCHKSFKVEHIPERSKRSFYFRIFGGLATVLALGSFAYILLKDKNK